MASKEQLMTEINQVSFALDDVTLYLDTHPADAAALDYFHQMTGRRKQALAQFEQEYYPLTRDCITSLDVKADNESKYAGTSHFTWVDGPAPWKGEC